MNEQNKIRLQQTHGITEEALKSWETTVLTFGVLSIVLCFMIGIGFGIAGLVWSSLVSLASTVCLVISLFPFVATIGGILLYLLMRINT